MYSAVPRGTARIGQSCPVSHPGAPCSLSLQLQIPFVQEYATEVDVDFVRKSVRAIGRCAIKVEQSAERCVSTLLDLIQTKVRFYSQFLCAFNVADLYSVFLLYSDPDPDHHRNCNLLKDKLTFAS
jgi:hypothetical protein